MNFKKDIVQPIKWLLSLANYRSIIALFSFIALGFLQGIGIFMLVPLLSLLSFGNSSPNNKVNRVKIVFEQLGIPIQIETVVVLFLCIISIAATIKYFSTVNNSQIIQNYSNSLRKKIHLAVLESSWIQITKSKSADIIGVLSREVGQVAFGVTNIFNLIGVLVILTVHLLIACFISLPFTLCIIFGSGIILFAHQKLFGTAFKMGKSVTNSMKNLQSSLQELFMNSKQAKSMGANEQQTLVFNTISQEVYEAQQNMSKQKAIADFSFEIASSLLISFFLLAVYFMQMHQIIDLIVLMYLFSRIFPAVKSLITNINNIVTILPAVIDVKEKLDFLSLNKEDVTKSDLKPTLVHGIDLNNINFSYPEKTIFKNLSLHIPANKITAIMGASGCGKSTLADIITGLLKPTSGVVLIDKQPLTNIGLHNWRQIIGYMPQECFLFHDTIKANLLWAYPQATDDEIWEALEIAEAKDFVTQLPKGLQTVVGDRGARMSGGQKQRISLARVILRKPKLLILDEATNALDEENEVKIFNTILKLKNTTVIIITHRLSTLKNADYLYHVKNGTFEQIKNR